MEKAQTTGAATSQVLLMTEEQAAERLMVSPRTLAKWRSQGAGGPEFVALGARVAYTPEALERWVVERQVKSSAEAKRKFGRPRRAKQGPASKPQ